MLKNLNRNSKDDMSVSGLFSLEYNTENTQAQNSLGTSHLNGNGNGFNSNISLNAVTMQSLDNGMSVTLGINAENDEAIRLNGLGTSGANSGLDHVGLGANVTIEYGNGSIKFGKQDNVVTPIEFAGPSGALSARGTDASIIGTTYDEQTLGMTVTYELPNLGVTVQGGYLSNKTQDGQSGSQEISRCSKFWSASYATTVAGVDVNAGVGQTEGLASNWDVSNYGISVSNDMGAVSVDVVKTEIDGSSNEKSTRGGISYKWGDLKVSYSMEDTDNLGGTYDSDFKNKSVGLGYTIAQGVSASLTYNDWESSGSSTAGVTDDAFTVGLSVAF